MINETQPTSDTTAETPPRKPRRVRAVLSRELYRRVAVQAAREESAPNAIVVRALAYYLDHAERQP